MTEQCYHCGLVVPENAPVQRDIKGSEETFCCIGCASVCEAIHEAGMEGFYQRTAEGELLAPPPPPPKNIELYDYDEVQSEFTQDLGDIREIHLLAEGIHCAACVWLIESTLAKLDGVKLGHVNLTSRRVKIRWDNRKIQLSTIIGKLAKVGYSVVPFDPNNAEAALKKKNRALLYRVAFAAFAMMNIMWIAVSLYTGADEGEFKNFFHWVAFGIATPTLIYSGYPFLKGAWDALRSRRLGMDVPISIGLLTTYFYSLYITIFVPEGDVYFDTLIDLMLLLLVGRYLEAISRTKAVDSTQRLMDLQPKVALKLEQGEEKILPIRLIKTGDWVRIKPGEKFPVDGVIKEGATQVNESMLTGESREIHKYEGDEVCAGTINLNGTVSVEVRSVLQDTALGRIIALVEEAQNSKAPIQCTADKIIPYFVTTTLTLATASLLYWLQFDVNTAILAATAVLIITCPCAFGLATPMAIAVASGVSARMGIFVKNGAVLETLSSVDHIIFDKTGTLTKGEMSVVKTLGSVSQYASLVHSIEQRSEHSIANAIQTYFEPNANQSHSIDQFRVLAGQGVQATVDGLQIRLGSHSWLKQLGVTGMSNWITDVEAEEAKGHTCVWLAVDGKTQGVLVIADTLRDDAHALIKALKDDQIGMTLLSGDRAAVAHSIAKELDATIEVIAEVMPSEKDAVVQRLQAQGKIVAVVGDGINDAPALARADVGIAIGSGTDVSMDSADIVLMNSQLMDVYNARELSQQTLRTIRQNIGLSISYNIIMVPLAMSAVLTPMIAAITMPLSSLLVIGNAARLRRFKKR